jgi:hypothetical protein
MASPTANREVESGGELLTTLARPGYRGGPVGELRVSLDEFQGHGYLGVRLWEAGRDGVFRPTKKGMAIRFSEARQVAAAILEGLERSGWQPPPEGPPASAGRQRRRGPEVATVLTDDRLGKIDEQVRRGTPPWKDGDQ